MCVKKWKERGDEDENLFMRREKEMGEGNMKKRRRERKKREKRTPGHFATILERLPQLATAFLSSFFQSRSFLPWVKEFESSEPVRGYLREKRNLQEVLLRQR